MVFIGAFFLMNLTLAVINAAFSQTSNDANEPGNNSEYNNDADGPNLDDIDHAVGG
jgi:hypothetical protein